MVPPDAPTAKPDLESRASMVGHLRSVAARIEKDAAKEVTPFAAYWKEWGTFPASAD